MLKKDLDDAGKKKGEVGEVEGSLEIGEGVRVYIVKWESGGRSILWREHMFEVMEEEE